MDKKFTPGPWSFTPSIPEEGVECYWIQNSVQFVTAVDGPQNDEREANARLIAAAPDLLHALRALLNETTGPDEVWAEGTAVEHARAAIAKATGDAT